jgi:hypothetical protein
MNNKRMNNEKRNNARIANPRERQLVVDIIEYSNEYFPGWVRCSFVDVFGATQYINEKAPVVSVENITEDTKLPIKGYVGGEIILRKGDIVHFCTEKPWGILSEEGESKFYVYERQLID